MSKGKNKVTKENIEEYKKASEKEIELIESCFGS